MKNSGFKTVMALAAVSAVALGAALWSLTDAQAQPGTSSGIGSPAVVWSTESATTSQLVTNKVLAYNVTSPLSNSYVVIDCTKGKELCLQFRFRYTTTTIPATNTMIALTSAVEGNALGSTNRSALTSWTMAGSTIDGGYITATTNITVNGRPYVYVDAVLALAPLTNATLKAFVK